MDYVLSSKQLVYHSKYKYESLKKSWDALLENSVNHTIFFLLLEILASMY